MNARGTFCGLPAHTDPQKVSALHGPQNRLLLRTRRSGHGDERVSPSTDRARSLRVTRFGALRPSLSKIGAAGCRCLRRSPHFERMDEVHTHPSRSRMAKVEIRFCLKKQFGSVWRRFPRPVTLGMYTSIEIGDSAL